MFKTYQRHIRSYFKYYSQKYKIIDVLIISIILCVVLTLIDYENLPSKFFSIYPAKINFVVSICALLFIVFTFIKLKIVQLLKKPLVNILDQLNLILLITTPTFYLLSMFNIPHSYVKYITIVTVPITLLILGLRVHFTSSFSNSNSSTVIDLKDVLDDNLPDSENYLIKESAVNYDLLDRTAFVQDIQDNIINYASSEKFVIGIEGTWGTGKTTLLQQVKLEISNRDDVILIDDFDPWISEDKEALLDSLLTTILKESNIEIPDSEINFFITSTLNLVLGTKISPSILRLFKIQKYNINQLTMDINSIIDHQNKKIVFVIDNLDRLLPENVFLILNIVNNVLVFHNLIIILSYDRAQLTHGLRALGISDSYLDKIVQKRIVLPLVKPETRNSIYYNALKKILTHYDLEFDDQALISFANILASNSVDLREFKKYLNSIVLPFVHHSKPIFITDYLAIKYLQFTDLSLYTLVYNGIAHFTSSNNSFSLGTLYADSNTYDNLLTGFFQKITYTKNSQLEKALLKILFPYFKNFLDGGKNYRNNASVEPRESTNKRIFDAKFFYLYFTDNTNSASATVDSVKKFIETANTSGVTPHEVNTYLQNTFNNLSTTLQNDFLSYMEEDITKISNKKIVAVSLITLYYEVSEVPPSFLLPIKVRICLVIEKLLNEFELNISQQLIKPYTLTSKFLSLLDQILYWLENDSSSNQKLIDYIKNALNTLCSASMNQNIYSNDLYEKNNLATLYKWLNEANRLSELKPYVTAQINNDTVYRILNNVVTISASGNSYGYRISDDVLDIVNTDTLQEYVNSSSPANEFQKLLAKVFNKYQENPNAPKGDITIYTNHL